MKPSTIRKLGAPLVAGVLLLTTGDSWARLPRPVKATGTVVSVDHQTRSLVLKAGKEAPCTFEWSKETEFVKGGQPATAEALKPGASVVIYYHAPTFGKPHLHKVVWEENNQQTKPTDKKEGKQ